MTIGEVMLGYDVGQQHEHGSRLAVTVAHTHPVPQLVQVQDIAGALMVQANILRTKPLCVQRVQNSVAESCWFHDMCRPLVLFRGTSGPAAFETRA